MGETKARVDALIERLSDVSDQVRLEAIDELSTIDTEHALPALHWAIQNELDERVRNAARDAYQKLSRVKQAEKVQQAAAEDKTRAADRPKVKAVTVEEGAENPAGSLSFKLGVLVAVALVVWVFIQSGQDPGRVPAWITWWLRIAGALSLPGLVLGIIGVAKKGERHIPAIAGTVLNSFIVIVYVFAVLLPWIRH
jgi:hypothetical protein